MHSFLDFDKEEQALIINNTAQKMGLSNAIVEKDYWVCWVLEYLFNKFEYRDYTCFKGGTSLSKVYNAIERFSEDIDLALDWSLLNLNKEVAYFNRSITQQNRFNQEANRIAEEHIKDV